MLVVTGCAASPMMRPCASMMVALRLPAPRSMPSRWFGKSFPWSGLWGEVSICAMQHTIELAPSLQAARLSVAEIPVIDVSALRGGARTEMVAAIGKACREIGFFYAVGHGVDEG